MRVAIIADNISWRGVGVSTSMQIKLLLERGIDITLVAPNNELKNIYNLTKIYTRRLIVIPIPSINVGFTQILESRKVSHYLDKSLNNVDLIYIPNMYYWALKYAKKKHLPSIIAINMPWPICFYQNLFFKHNPCSGCVWSKSRSSFNDYVRL